MNKEVVLGKLIRAKRLSLNLTMDYVAKKAKTTRATLWSIETGDSNCSLKTLLGIMNVLNLAISVDNFTVKKTKRHRATRTNTLLDKKINRFVITCVEQFAKSNNVSSNVAYKKMLKNNVIDELTSNYEDLHGMSTMYLNDYIASLI